LIVAYTWLKQPMRRLQTTFHPLKAVPGALSAPQFWTAAKTKPRDRWGYDFIIGEKGRQKAHKHWLNAHSEIYLGQQ